MRRRIKKTEECLNCGTHQGDANYCPTCGQFNNSHKPSILELIRDALENLFAFDSRFYRSLIPLLWRPGRLSRDFNEGKRSRYVLPIRLFILITILLIAAVSCENRFSNDHWYEVDRPKEADNSLLSDNADRLFLSNMDKMDKGTLDSLVENGFVVYDPNIDKYKLTEKVDSRTNIEWDFGEGLLNTYYQHARLNPLQPVDDALIELNKEPTFWNHLLYSNILKISLMNSKEFFRYIGRNILFILLLFIPFIALTLKGLYFYKGIYYVDHFVFAIHLQTAQLAYAILLVILTWITNWDILYFIYFTGIAVYTFLALKRYYEQSGFVTFIKFSLLNLSMLIVSIIFIFLVASVSVILY